METESWLAYVWWSYILIVKMMIFTWYTGRLRVHRKVIHSESDRIFVAEPGVILDPTGGGHPDIDRIRSVHRSDLEIVLPFLIITLIWLETSVPPSAVKSVLRWFTFSRICHSLFYMEIIIVHQLIKIFISVLSYALVTYVAVSCILFYA
ncbi:prostaglandin E synthase-like [Athalia rosae]|uniref:prostaglandin E synthase-like n=1 Tax=Athalia rosae TaxID=37344 RepID=UPI0020340BA3|nr:prostaglandin E synthase-like [Athalia rosae]XP_020710747.2 prostaglandin E synthase-like [Athalia rosae]